MQPPPPLPLPLFSPSFFYAWEIFIQSKPVHIIFLREGGSHIDKRVSFTKESFGIVVSCFSYVLAGI